MELHAAPLPLPSVGATPLNLDDYTVGEHRERRPVADVYDAVHRYSGARHLLYVLRPRAMQDRVLVHRIGCEIDAARWLRHASVPKLDRQGETPSRRLYVAVEHRPGPSLRAVVTESGGLPAQEVVRLAAPLVEALEEAHALGLVHGRLTPDAISVTDDGAPLGGSRVVLTGLGLASIGHPGELAADERAFVSPEQLAGEAPGVRSDVFGLAAVLDYALHGEVHVGDQLAADAGERGTVVGVLRAARSVDSAARPPSVRALWEELLSALVVGTLPSEAPRQPGDAVKTVLPAPPPLTRRRAARAYTWGLAIPMAAALGWPLARGGAHTPTSRPSHSVAGEVVPPAVRAPGPKRPPALARAVDDQVASGARPTGPSNVRPSDITRPNARQSAAQPAAERPSPTRDDAAARTPSQRVEVPTFVIINAEAAPRTAASPGEFGDRFNPARGAP